MHLRTETALDLLQGRLEKAEDAFWRKHLDQCGICFEEVGHWRRLIGELAGRSLKSAPDRDLEKAFGIYSRERESVQPAPRQTLATIVFDSFVEPALAGARGAAAGARQIVLRAEEFDIHIKIWGEPDHLQLLGQLLPRRGDEFVESARFHLLRNGERLDTTAIDKIGEFRFSDVPEGELSLQIDLPNLTVIGALKIQEVQ